MFDTTPRLVTDTFTLSVPATAACLWQYDGGGGTYRIAPPVFEIDGAARAAVLRDVRVVGETTLPNGVREHRLAGAFADDPCLALALIFRVADGDPVVRVRYELSGMAAHRLTKSAGADALTYLTLDLAGAAVTEVRFSEFNEMVHSFCLVEAPLADRHFADSTRAMGPMLVAQAGGRAWLAAYEHGSQVPDAFLAYQLAPDATAALRAVKGNYVAGHRLDTPYRTLWLQFAAVAGDTDTLAAAYRAFVLRHQTQNLASRTPYIFYNTWAYQERNNSWHGARFLDSMHQARMLQEIDIAHAMGIEVFVLDTGWYEKTGDWRVNLRRFPDGLRAVKAKLDGYGMKLGLWFGPLHAALTSAMHADHQDCIMAWQGQPAGIHQVWETEESQNLCLVSRYREAFADELIRLVREVGVTYFKWDAIGQYGCDAPGHGHGDADASAGERADNYAFQLGLAMVDVVDRLCAACPKAIVDFDITEGGRFVGLGFLSAGKYFLINNGPYFGNYNIPDQIRNWCNIFVWPGPARGWICRTPLTFDKWIPSVLFLTHYLPDDPAASQYINIASLILGQNGIWGDLPAISAEGVARFGTLLGLYKQVRGDITAATLRRSGPVGGNPEVYEKVNPATGRGAVCIFASAHGTYTYVTEAPVDPRCHATEGAHVTFDPAGRAIITATFDQPSARIVYFGVTAGAGS
jgi:alpha-galactosidase